jgi:oxalate decarboxylase
MAPLANAQQVRSDDHSQPNEEQPGENNTPLDAENPSSVWSPETDNGTVEPFKYSFALAHKRIEDGGWTRQVTERELPISKTMAGVEMRLITGGVRELHWHTSAEWAFMIYGNARITAVDAQGRSFVNDVTKGDLWLFPGGIPHSIQGLGPDGAMFLLVFNDGSFNEFETFLLTDWFKHTPKEVWPRTSRARVDLRQRSQEGAVHLRRRSAAASGGGAEGGGRGYGAIDGDFVFRASTMPPTKVRAGGEVRIVEKKNFPATDIAAAIVR